MLREKRPCSLFHFKEKPELAEWVVLQVCKIDIPLEHGFLRAQPVDMSDDCLVESDCCSDMKADG